MSTARERMMAAKSKRIELAKKETEELANKKKQRWIAAEKRKIQAAENKKVREEFARVTNPVYTTQTHKPAPNQSNQTITIELDYNEFRKHITSNQSELDENLIYRTCFKPYYKGGKLGKRGRQEALTEAIFRVLQSNSKKLVKKVTREEII